MAMTGVREDESHPEAMLDSSKEAFLTSWPGGQDRDRQMGR